MEYSNTPKPPIAKYADRYVSIFNEACGELATLTHPVALYADSITAVSIYEMADGAIVLYIPEFARRGLDFEPGIRLQ